MLFEKPINPQVPVYMSEIMEDIIRITGKVVPGHRELVAKVERFKKGCCFSVGKEFKITPYLMDHSASESFAFLIEAEGKKIIYTGDYREHGHKANAFKYFLAKDMGQVDLIITEGTQAAVESGGTEKEVMRDIGKLLAHKKGAVYVMCSGQNVDLLTSLGCIADQTGRFLVVDAYVALILERIKEFSRKTGNEFAIPCLDKKYLKVIEVPTNRNVRSILEYAETVKKIDQKIVPWEWIGVNLDKLIIPVRTYSQSWVEKHIKDFKDAIFIYSMWYGYQEEIAFHETIEYFQSKGVEKHEIHVSGHAYLSTIRKLIKSKNPKYVIPIHTEHPEIFVREFGEKVRIMKNGETFVLD
jgi:ribonuclease J